MISPLLLAALIAQEPCLAFGGRPAASRDLYCIELLAASDDALRGTAQLDWPGGPFTVAVTADGTHRWRITTRLAGLPPLRGRRAGYVAWAAPPSMSPIVKLGVVRNGLTRLGDEVAFDRFAVLITAEQDTATNEMRGSSVLRGESAGNRLRPADIYQYFLGSMTGRPQGPPLHNDHLGPAAPDSLGWTSVPMYPGLDMLPAEMALRPGERAWLPEGVPGVRGVQGVLRRTVSNGDTIELTAGLVRRTLAGREFTMMGFNGQHPGPLLDVPQGGQITIRFTNRLPVPTTVHWHGLRLENRFDGVPELTQPEVLPGATFSYSLRFPDGGIFWYHPHVREDVQQDLGLYGNIFVRDGRESRVQRSEFLMLDDILIGQTGLVPYGAGQPTHAAMGRFGNTFLVNGETGWRATVGQGEVVRFYLTNAANTRTFNVSFGPGSRMKLVGSDLGAYARETWVESIVIAPAERYVVDVRFERPGDHHLVNRVRALDHLYGRFFSKADTLGTVTVADSRLPIPDTDWAATRAAPTDIPLPTNDGGILEMRVEFTGLPFVSEQLMRIDSVFFNPVEWDGTMPGMNWATTGRQARWIIRDSTGAENMDIRRRYRVGDVLRLRLVGARDALHGMQHPMHLHGQRFLVLAVNGIPNENPVWKDTALLPAGSSLDILVEFSNPGRWMFHCHIAEHLQSGMMMIFDVEEAR